MKNITFLLLLIFVSIEYASAQTISGKILSKSTNEALEGSNVRLSKMNDDFIDGTIAGAKGEFVVKCSYDSLKLHISSIGYTGYDLTINKESNQNIDIGNVMLEEETHVLQQMVVVADAVFNTPTRTLMYPTSLQLKSSSSGFDLLRNMNLEGLLIDVDNQSVKSSLASAVIYKINGVTSSLQQIVALQPKQIDRVEYNSTATARYANEDAAVINIVLKEANVGTFLSNDFKAAFTTGFINEQASVQTIFGKSQIAINYGLNWRSYDDVHGIIDQKYKYPDKTINRHQTYDDAPFHYTHQNIDISYVYNDNTNTFSVKLNTGILKSRDESVFNIYENKSADVDIIKNTHQKDNFVQPSLDLYYRRSFDKEKTLEFNLIGSLTNTDFDRRLSEDHIKEIDQTDYFYQNTDGRKQSFIFEGFYSDNAGNVNFSAGVRGAYTHTKNTYIYDNVSKLDQLDAYPYVEIRSKLGKVTYTLSTGLKVLKMDNYAGKKSYYRNLTTLSLFYKKNDVWNLRYNFRYSPNYPSLGVMSDVEQREDSIIIKRGNPNIKPSQNVFNRLQLSVNYKKLRTNASAYAQKIFDFIESDIIYDPIAKSMVKQSDNFPYMASYGLEVELSANSLLDIFTINGGLRWDEYKSKINGEHYSFNAWIWYLTASANYKDFTLYGGYRSPAKSLYGQTITLNENYSQVSLSYKLSNFTLSAGMMWAFTSGSIYGSENMSNTAPSSTVRYIRNNMSMIRLGVRYNVNWGKSMFNIKKNIQNSDNGDRGIL